jgi:hypothetical protein
MALNFDAVLQLRPHSAHALAVAQQATPLQELLDSWEFFICGMQGASAQNHTRLAV